MWLRSSFGTLLISFAFMSSASAATLVVNGSGILTGVTNVIVGDTLYTVEFVDTMTCAEAFTGCDEPTDFVFTTEADARAAATALSVVFDSPGIEPFDSHPELQLGCGLPTFCDTITPFGFVDPVGVRAAFFANSVAGFFEGVFVADFLDGDTASNPALVYGRWTSTGPVPPIPEPTTLTLLGLGLAGMGARRWRERSAS